MKAGSSPLWFHLALCVTYATHTRLRANITNVHKTFTNNSNNIQLEKKPEKRPVKKKTSKLTLHYIKKNYKLVQHVLLEVQVECLFERANLNYY